MKLRAGGPRNTRNVDALLMRYGEFHRDPINKAIHWVCVPLIMCSLLGMLWAGSPVASLIAVAAAIIYYWTLSPMLAVGMAGVAAVMLGTLWLLGRLVLPISVFVFIAAWAGQFIGHTIEGASLPFSTTCAHSSLRRCGCWRTSFGG